MVLFVLCFGVEFLCSLNRMYLFIFVVEGLSKPPVGKRLLPFLNQVEIRYCAVTAKLIVLLIIPNTLPVRLKCHKIKNRYGHKYVWLSILQASIYQVSTGSIHSQSNLLLDFYELLEMLLFWCLDKYRDRLPNFAFFSPPRPLSSGNLGAVYWEIAAHSAYDVFS